MRTATATATGSHSCSLLRDWTAAVSAAPPQGRRKGSRYPCLSLAASRSRPNVVVAVVDGQTEGMKAILRPRPKLLQSRRSRWTTWNPPADDGGQTRGTKAQGKSWTCHQNVHRDSTWSRHGCHCHCHFSLVNCCCCCSHYHRYYCGLRCRCCLDQRRKRKTCAEKGSRSLRRKKTMTRKRNKTKQMPQETSAR